MSIFRKNGRAFKAAFGMALFAAFGFVSVGAAADEPSSAESSDALASVDQYACTGQDGRAPMTLLVYANGDCERIPGETVVATHAYCSGGVCPSCYKLANKYLKCNML